MSISVYPMVRMVEQEFWSLIYTDLIYKVHTPNAHSIRHSIRYFLIWQRKSFLVFISQTAIDLHSQSFSSDDWASGGSKLFTKALKIICKVVASTESKKIKKNLIIFIFTLHLRTPVHKFDATKPGPRINRPSPNQCDQIRRFLEFLDNKFISKAAQSFGDFWGSCENHYF